MSCARRYIAIAALCGVSLAPTCVQAQNSGTSGEQITKVATTSAQFLKIGVGSRAIALGGSFVAQANDLSALYWNPAGLAAVSGSAVQLAYTQYLADVGYSYAAFGTSLGAAGTIGFSVLYLDSGTMDVRTIPNPEAPARNSRCRTLQSRPHTAVSLQTALRSEGR